MEFVDLMNVLEVVSSSTSQFLQIWCLKNIVYLQQGLPREAVIQCVAVNN